MILIDWPLTQVQIEEKGGELSISSIFDRFLTSEKSVADVKESEQPDPATKKQKKRNDTRTKMISVVVSLASIESISTIR